MTPSLPSLEVMVGDTGLEPARLSTLEPKSSASTNSANPPYMSPLILYEKRYSETSGLSFSLLWRVYQELNLAPRINSPLHNPLCHRPIW